MNGQLEKHLQNIEDFIQIDDKIVTYKWISKALKVHTNTAKQLLFAFTKKPEVNDKLLVTYIVAGEQQDGEGLSFRLVQEKDLEEVKKSFHKITSSHVYSIQRGTVVSGSDIYNADSSYKLTSEDHKFCSIQPEVKIERREMKVVVPKTQETTSSVSSKTIPKKGTPSVSHDTKPNRKSLEPVKTQDVPPNKEETEKKPLAPKKASPKKNDKKTVPAKGGNIGALFMKQAAKKKEESTAKVEKGVKGSEDVKEAKQLSEKLSKTEVKTPTANKTVAKGKRKKPTGGKDSTAKRRKRIQVASDSESSDQESDGNERFPSPEPEPDTPMVVESEEEEIIPSTPLEKSKKKRIRKLVDRTFEDEDGFIITKKEYVTESCSDGENSEPAVKKVEVETIKEEAKTEQKSLGNHPKTTQKEESPPPKALKNKQEPVAKGKPGRPASKAKTNGTSSPKKQASITNFFKKK